MPGYTIAIHTSGMQLERFSRVEMISFCGYYCPRGFPERIMFRFNRSISLRQTGEAESGRTIGKEEGVNQSEIARLKGIGPVLCQRLLAAGLDSCDKIVEAGEQGLKGIQGLSSRMIPSILSQAAAIKAEAGAAGEVLQPEAPSKAESLSDDLRDMVSHLRERFGEQLSGKDGRKIEKDILKILALLESLQGKRAAGKKRRERGIERAHLLLNGLDDAELSGVRKGLKKTRKTLERIFA